MTPPLTKVSGILTVPNILAYPTRLVKFSGKDAKIGLEIGRFECGEPRRLINAFESAELRADGRVGPSAHLFLCLVIP